MHLSMIILSSIALFAMSALSVGISDSLKIIRLSTTIPSGRPGNVNDDTINFSVWDDTPITNSSTTCSAAWDYQSEGWPQSYILCNDTNFEWYVSRWNSFYNFTLEVAHGYHDPSVGTPDYVRVFAHANVTEDDLQCAYAASGHASCELKEGHVIDMPIYAETA